MHVVDGRESRLALPSKPQSISVFLPESSGTLAHQEIGEAKPIGRRGLTVFLLQIHVRTEIKLDRASVPVSLVFPKLSCQTPHQMRIYPTPTRLQSIFVKTLAPFTIPTTSLLPALTTNPSAASASISTLVLNAISNSGKADTSSRWQSPRFLSLTQAHTSPVQINPIAKP